MLITKYTLSLLITDWLIWLLVLTASISIFWMRRQPQLVDAWRQVLQKRLGMAALVILGFYLAIGLLDSIHFTKSTYNQQQQISSQKIMSALDIVIAPLGQEDEKTYSKPFATTLYNSANNTPLQFVDSKNGAALLIMKGFITGLISFMGIACILIYFFRRKKHIAWISATITFGILWIITGVLIFVATHFHILGTDKIGQDVFYETIKSIRTGLLIGTLTTIFMLPFALILGTMAGYFQGIVDDVIQYIYTTLSSIPSVLLITASILVLQVYITNHTALFPTLIQRADARLLALCLILGITSWATLCRLLRGETLKLRELDYIQAARTLGVKKYKIILKHIVPNVMHIVLITIALDFSGLVLAEAVLSYVGVGVDPTTISWGNMINSSRLELAREPVVWWPLVAALIFMFILVLAANLFADAVRDAFDPKLRNNQGEPNAN